MNFEFLKEVTLKANPVAKTRVSAEDKVPTNGAHLRVFANGAVYPSVEFTEAWNLEYGKKNTISYGLDVTNSKNWGAYPSDAPQAIFVNRISRANPKIDLFGSVRYDDQGQPISSVTNQGSKTFGQELLAMVSEAYDVDFEGKPYVDLVVSMDTPVPSEDNIMYLPKKITRGDQTGTFTTVRRENITMFPLSVFTETTEGVVDTNGTTVEDGESTETTVEDTSSDVIHDSVEPSYEETATELNSNMVNEDTEL